MTPISFNSKALARSVDSLWHHAGGHVMWLPTSFTAPTNLAGDDVWTDGEDIYCIASNAFTYKLNKETKTWSQVSVGLPTGSGGYSVFKDGDTIYAIYNNGTTHLVYEFNQTTKRFSTNYTQDYQTSSADVWYNGGDIYYSMNPASSGDPHNLKWNRSTHKWVGVSMSFNPSLYGTYGLIGNAVWNYNNNSYVGDWDSDGNFLRLYKFNHSTSAWNETSWSGFCAVTGIDIWTDYDGNMIYSNGTVQYKLNTSNSKWEPYNRWYVMPAPYRGRYVWSDGTYTYWGVHNTNSEIDYVLVR